VFGITYAIPWEPCFGQSERTSKSRRIRCVCEQPDHTLHLHSCRFAAEARRHKGDETSSAGTGTKGSAPFSTCALLKRRAPRVEVVHLDGFIGGPDRDRTDDLFHAISATSRNSLKLHDTNRAVTVPNAHIFPVIGPLMDPHPIGVDCHPGSPRGTGIFSAKFRIV
jgi:hypothetical protein